MKLLATVSVAYSSIRASARLVGAMVAKAALVVDAPRIRVTATQYVLQRVAAASVAALVASTTFTLPLASVQAGAMKATIVPAIELQDDVFAIDSVTFDAATELVDSATPIDTLTAAVSKVMADAFTPSEMLVASMAKMLSDSASALDALAIAFGKSLADSATATDALTIAVAQALADSAAATDDLVKSISNALADSAVATDSLDRVWSAQLVLNDSVTATDVPILDYVPAGGVPSYLNGAYFNRRVMN